MAYEFTTKAHGQEGMYGVKYESLNDETRVLFKLAWWGWTADEIQMIIDNSKALKGDEEFRYQVEDDLGISVFKEEVYFFNLHNREKEIEDMKWPFNEFIAFMEDFKKFIQANRWIY